MVRTASARSSKHPSGAPLRGAPAAVAEAASKAAAEARLTTQQLEGYLWSAADILRGSIDSSDYKNFIFGLMLLKRLSDRFEEECEQLVADGHDPNDERKLGDAKQPDQVLLKLVQHFSIVAARSVMWSPQPTRVRWANTSPVSVSAFDLGIGVGIPMPDWSKCSRNSFEHAVSILTLR